VPRLSVTVDEKNFRLGALEILKTVRPSWTTNGVDKIKSKVFTDGLSNKMVGFYLEGNREDTVIVKVFGSNTGKLIDREAEIETMRILHERKCGAQLYATFSNGICYEYMNGEILDVKDCWDPAIWPLITAEMAKLHSSREGGGLIDDDDDKRRARTPKSAMWQKMRQFNKLAEEVMQNDPNLCSRLETVGVQRGWASGAIDELVSMVESKGIPVTFCHNDLICRNIVHDPKRKRVTFIDVEYAGPNYAAFDVANHFLEFAGVPELDYSRCPDREFRHKWISEYLRHLKMDEGRDMSVELFDYWVDLCTPASHLLWGLWAIHQARHSTIDFDYIRYVGIRLAEYKKCMEALRKQEQRRLKSPPDTNQG